MGIVKEASPGGMIGMKMGIDYVDDLFTKPSFQETLDFQCLFWIDQSIKQHYTFCCHDCAGSDLCIQIAGKNT